MKLNEVLSRADNALADLMPVGTLDLVRSIDQSLAYPKNLIKVLLRLRPADVLLTTPRTRDQLLLMLTRQEAETLAILLKWDKNGNVYDFLKNIGYRSSKQKLVLFDFFGVEMTPSEVPAQVATRIEVSPDFALFSHQARALRRVESFLEQEPRRVLLHMPTGSGKTRTAMNAVANYLRNRDKGVVVWLAHSEELCEQAHSEFSKAWRSLGIRNVPLIRYWGGHEADLSLMDDGLIIVGLKKAYHKLINEHSQFNSLSAKDPLVVMDEAHQAIAPTYQLIINQLLRPRSNAQLLGLSATPGRTWNNPDADRELSEFFAMRKVTLEVDNYKNPVMYLIDEGYLASPSFTQIKVTTNLSLTSEELAQVRDTFELPSTVLDRLGDDEKRNLLIVHHAEQLLKRHSRVILFASSVRQSDLLSAVLYARGHWAASITTKSPNTRLDSIAAFKADDTQPKILCNFGVLTTGFDAPKTSAALIARPTLSLVLYSQMVGRAMRGINAGGNENCEILTVVDTQLPGFDSVCDAFANWEDIWS